MKVPGRAWLEFEVTGDEDSSTVRQTAVFDPVGLFGQAYWYALFPVHQLVFRGMLKGIATAALEAPSLYSAYPTASRTADRDTIFKAIGRGGG